MLLPLQLKLKGLAVRQRASQGSNSATEHQQVVTTNGRERAQHQLKLGQKHAHGEGSALQCIQRGHKYGGMIPLQQKELVSPWTPHPARSEIMEHVMHMWQRKTLPLPPQVFPRGRGRPTVLFLDCPPAWPNPTTSSSCLLRWPSPSFPHFP